MKATDVARLLVSRNGGKVVTIYSGDYKEARRRFKIWSEDLWEGWSLKLLDKRSKVIMSFELAAEGVNDGKRI